MLCDRVIFLIAVAFTVTTNDANIQPTDLVDEAKVQLEQLKSIIQGEISTGHNSLYSKNAVFGRSVAMTANGAAAAMSQVYNTISAEIRTLKDLAFAADKDVSTCTNEPEQTLNDLRLQRMNEMTVCLHELNDQVREELEHSKYIVDVTFNTVNHLEFQILRCKGDLLCLSPLLNEIELNKIKVPQSIKTEVQTFEQTVNLLTLSVNSCYETNVAPYTTEAYQILEEIQICVDKIIG